MSEVGFGPLELDALKELMNVGFGRAAATLSEVMDLHVVLSVPRIELVPIDELAAHVGGEVDDPKSFNVVEQFFLGQFEGSSFLLLPEEEGRRLVDLLVGEDADADAPLDSLERDTIIEIGNIIIGACVSKVAELLGDVVTYRPPRFAAGALDRELLARYVKPGPGMALVMKTLFRFERRDVFGLLFLVTTDEGLGWLKRAVAAWLESLS